MDRFWHKVDVAGVDECWEWTASRRNGYGQFGLNGKVPYAHRIAYELCVGPIPDGHDVCHTCDNPPCVNPDHLFVGTRKENMRDMTRKGRGGRKLDRDDVENIRANGMNLKQTELADIFGVDQSTISTILSRKVWAV